MIRTVERIVQRVPHLVWVSLGALLCIALLLAFRALVARVEARRKEREKELLAKAVGTLQAALLPTVDPQLNSVSISVAYRPADGPAAGGDFYDAFALPEGKVGVIVGDVSGHGERALPKTALLRYTLRTYLAAGLPPRTALAAAGITLDRDLKGCFATALLAVVDPASLTLTFASAGHPLPLVVGLSRAVACAPSAPPLGSGLRTGQRQTTVALPTGATVCFFTDGLVEARRGRELFGRERLARELERLGPAAEAKTLLQRVCALSTRRGDDMAACILRLPKRAPHQVPGIVTEELEVDHETSRSARPALFLTAAGLTGEEAGDALKNLRATLEGAPAALLRLTWCPKQVAPEVAVVPVSPAVVPALAEQAIRARPEVRG